MDGWMDARTHGKIDGSAAQPPVQASGQPDSQTAGQPGR